MALNFPASPSLDQIHQQDGASYEWTGSKWRRTETFEKAIVVEYSDIVEQTSNTALIEPDKYNYFKITVDDNTTITVPSASPYSSFVVELALGGTAYTVTWSNNVEWAGGSAPSYNYGYAAKVLLDFTTYDGTNWVGSELLDYTPPFDQYFNYVSLLLHGDGTQGAQNNTFLDNSTNNFTITRSGNATQGSFSPYGDRWSAYFDGGANYLTTSTTPTDLLPGTTNTTFECWIQTTSSTDMAIFSNFSASSPFSGVEFGVNNGYQTFWSQGAWINRPTGNTGLGTLNDGGWHHLAWVITNSGTSLSTYVDGVLNYTASITPSTTGKSTQSIGADSNTVRGRYFNGYISNLRFVKGTALYTSNFTPPTEPLTAVTGTSLLTCQSNRFKDSSVNNFTLTKSGDVKVTKFSPYDQSAYNASTLGGSVYLDGAGDYLVLPEVASTSGDVTIEVWINPSKNQIYNGDAFIIGNNINDLGTWAISFAAPTNKIGVWLDGYFSLRIVSTATVNRESWNHIALVKTAGIIRLYINGIQESTTIAQSANFGQGSNVYIGEYNAGGQPYTGYISDVRVVNGTALYTSNFTPPTEPLTAVTNTSLLCNFTNAAIFDSAAKNVLETVGNAQIDTSVVKYGTGSIKLDGTGDYVVQPTSPNYGYGTGDFTIEFWLYLNSTASQTIVSNLSTATSTNPHIFIDSTIRYSAPGGNTRITGAALSTGQWYHISICRSSASTKLFVDGSQSGATYFDTNNYGSAAPLGIGTYWNSGSPATNNTLNGYIDDLRITKGVARYTENFTPLSQAFFNE